MKLLATLLLLIPLAAQDAQKPAGDAAKPADQSAKPADQAPASDSTAAAAPAASSSEGWLQGSIELGYRWIPNIDGSRDTYRSIVNLGEGPKLLDADFTILNPTKKIFDRADVHASSWGGDPYNTLLVDINKNNWYRLTADYRNIAYFNFLPSYADPTISQGSLLDQNSFDTSIRTLNVQLDLLPNKWITPYLAFGRNTQFGRGITVFQSGQNEYPVAALYSDQTNNYRGGVRIELGKYHFDIEQGGTTYREDQGASDNIQNPGNFTGLFLGQQLSLSELNELYRVRGDSVYTKVLAAANPFSWLSITGVYVYARPETDINYSELSQGNFYLNRILQFYSTGQDMLTGDASMPHTSANITVELRPWRRWRIVQYWNTERYHNTSSALLAEDLLFSGSTLTDQQLAADRLNLNQSQEEVDVYFDVTSKLTVRGGYRYVWGDTDVRAPILVGLALESATLRRHVGIAGFNYRMTQKFRVTADAEGSNSGQTFFRTSLQEYQKARIRGSYDITPTLRVAGDFSLLNNSNPDPSIKLDFASRVESASLFWKPSGGKWGNLLVDYSRSAIRSNILYLIPQILSPTPSLYRENAHSLTVLASVKWFSFGGSLFLSSGSRPANYYQPLARLSIPLNKHIRWNTEWRWYSMAESFYAFEDFRSNQLMTSLRFTR